jgi:4-amino-4-deoxy-L-arabinose transferase-like glycosyltransferase
MAHDHCAVPQIIKRDSISTQLRTVLAIIVGVCILGALFPESDLIPFSGYLQTSRSVQAATQATRWLFLSGACVFAFAFAEWHRIRRGIFVGIQATTRWSNKTFWGLACGSAFALRLLLLLLAPLFASLGSDALWYHNTAIAIAAGKGLQLHGVPTAYRPPGYSTLLALSYRLLGPSPEWAWFWGIASTGIILLTTYHIAYRLYGKIIARIATLIIAFYPALILYTAQPMSDLVFTAGLMLVWYVVALNPPYRWFETIGVGFALGLLTLTRSVSIGLFLVVPLLWFIKQANVRKLLLHSVLLTCAFAACVIPWMFRNYAIFNTATLGTNAGLNLFIGNHAHATGGYDVRMRPEPLARSNLSLNEAQIDRINLDTAIQFIIKHPIDELSILPKKIVHLFLLEVTAAQALFQDQPFWVKYGSYGFTQIFYLLILICFTLRVFNLLDDTTRPRGIQLMGFIIILYFTMMAILFYGLDRYRLPFLPWMIIESSIVIAWLANFDEVSKPHTGS